MAHYRKKKKKQWDRLMELAAEAGSIVMSMRDRPTRLDWLSVGLRSVALAAKVRRDMRAANALDPWDYFIYDGLAAPWTPFPDALAPLVIKHACDAEVDMDYWDEQDDSDRIYVAKLAGETVGWMADGDGRVREGPFMRSDREEQTHAALGRALWSQYGATRLLFGRDGLSPDPLVGQPSRPTAQFAALLERIRSFRAIGASRSYLFAGPPGTGKSTGMRFLAAALELRTLRIDIEVLAERFQRRDELLGSISTLVRALAPDVLVIDDIDRVREEERLLHLLELANRACALVLASANSLSDMSAACRRPGRFDEIVTVAHPDPHIVAMLLGADADLLDRLGMLPLAYIAEFAARRDALGREAALAELDALIARAVSQPDSS